jgi:DNA-binding GntR family transcriptional regulator
MRSTRLATLAADPAPLTKESRGDDAPGRALLTDEVYRALKWRILTHDLRPGGLFTEEELCRLLGYGRSPVHQAVHRLKYDGLVEILPRKGIVVRAFSARDINQLIEVRLPMEMEMARLAAMRATPAQLDALRARLAEGRRYLQRTDREGLMALDRVFHRGIAECTGNQVLTDTLENLHQRSMILWFVSVSSNSRAYDIVQEEHEEVLSCLEARDATGAAEAMRRHLEPFLQR